MITNRSSSTLRLFYEQSLRLKKYFSMNFEIHDHCCLIVWEQSSSTVLLFDVLRVR